MLLLNQVKEVINLLEQKGYTARSSTEDKMLKSLLTLKEMLETRKMSDSYKVAGPTGSCPCCGK